MLGILNSSNSLSNLFTNPLNLIIIINTPVVLVITCSFWRLTVSFHYDFFSRFRATGPVPAEIFGFITHDTGHT